MATGIQNAWSQTAASNGAADSAIDMAEGMAPSKVNDGVRALMALVRKHYEDMRGGIATSGTSTAFTITTNEGLTLADGVTVSARMHATSGASPTLNVDGTGAKAIHYPLGTVCPTAALVSGGVYRFVYNSSSTAWVVAAAPIVGTKAIGEIFETATPTAPAFSLLCYGQAVSRTTYAALFAAITKTVAGTTSNGSTTVSSVGEDLQAYGFVGAKIEGTGIPSGTTITAVGASSITLSQAATGSATITLTILPWGNGDGSTTFNIPDRRGRVAVGRDNMGGTSANRLVGSATGSIDGDKLGNTGGEETHQLITGELPEHGHAAGTLANSTTGAHTHTITADGYVYGSGAGSASAFTLSCDSAGFTSGSGLTKTSSGNGDHTHTISGSTANVGSDAAHNNVQPSIVSNFCIYAGV